MVSDTPVINNTVSQIITNCMGYKLLATFLPKRNSNGMPIRAHIIAWRQNDWKGSGPTLAEKSKSLLEMMSSLYLTLNNIWMRVQKVFDLLWRNVLTAPHYDVFQSTHHTTITIW